MSDFIAIYDQDQVVFEVATLLRDRSQEGIKKYGVTMDRTDLSEKEWLQHAIEEALDLAIYLTKIKREL